MSPLESLTGFGLFYGLTLPMDYGLLIAIEVIEALDRLPKRARRRLLDQFYKIRSFPGSYSDYPEYDAVGRRVEICIVAGWAVHY